MFPESKPLYILKDVKIKTTLLKHSSYDFPSPRKEAWSEKSQLDTLLCAWQYFGFFCYWTMIISAFGYSGCSSCVLCVHVWTHHLHIHVYKCTCVRESWIFEIASLAESGARSDLWRSLWLLTNFFTQMLRMWTQVFTCVQQAPFTTWNISAVPCGF